MLAGAVFLFAACDNAAVSPVSEQPAEPFKFGTFDIGGQPTLGLVLQDRFVVELEAANQDLELQPQVSMAKDMKEMAGRYSMGLNKRVYEIVNTLTGENLLEGSDRPPYVHDVGGVRTLAPILYPNKILNAAGNYYGHVSEASPPEEQAKAAEERRKDRGSPYLFHKSRTNAVIGTGDPIIMPKGRPKLDWECELAAVIGRPAKYVTAAQAKDHIFGFTIEVDVSDRGGRGDDRFGGSDWLIGKGHDTFAPMGPYIVPFEFIEDPMDLGQKLTVSGQVMQDARSSDMIHNIYELIEYGSWVMTLESGDVVSGGSPQGAGISRTARAEQVFMKPGDVLVASIEGIGTLTHNVVEEGPDAATPPFTVPTPSVKAAEPFKFGTFEIDGKPTLSLVLRDRFVAELGAANDDLEGGAEVAMPQDMKELAGRYHMGLQDRVYQVVNHLVGENLLEGDTRPGYVHEVADVRTLAPILFPNKILNAAGNYYGHVSESSTPEEQAKVAEARRRDRGIPYLFHKTTTSGVIGNGDPIYMPKDRPKVDWECEIAAIIGQPAKYVPVDRAKNHIFGYTIEIDVSDRGGRPDRPRSDWLLGKGHDGFAPMGPFVVPAEFIENPMDLGQKLTVNGEVMQDSRSTDMIHNLYELIEYGSSILTLESGDVISGGSPRGTGMSRSARPEQVFLKPGDVMVATVEGIGSLTHEVKATEGGGSTTN
jgi:2-keto-4-pentenoate hydratase/2-oxohepta-3-ene-1,7-dioic acid hydratase in catechol pathway